jgi:hypothetical protein
MMISSSGSSTVNSGVTTTTTTTTTTSYSNNCANKSINQTSSFSNNNTSLPSLPSPSSSSQCNQGKLVYLDKKFTNHRQTSDEVVKATTTATAASQQETIVVTARASSNNEPGLKQKKRLSCEELENLKERFVDFINLDPEQSMLTKLQTMQANSIKQQSRLSVLSAESSSGESSSLSNTSSDSVLAQPPPPPRPEPPQRTVSIRNSTCNIYSSSSLLSGESNINNNNNNNNNTTLSECYYQSSKNINSNNNNNDDCLSMKSNSIYSTCRMTPTAGGGIQPVRSSRSVFSIYEEEDEESCSAVSSNSSSSAASNGPTAGHTRNPYFNTLSTTGSKLERLSDFEIKKIESFLSSLGSLVTVSSCTCDLFSTTSEQIANLLNDCWKAELSCMVPVWLLDTGFNPKRGKQLRLLFVDRRTAFPLSKPILIKNAQQLRNPNNDKRLTFTLQNKQLVCLIQFYDFLSCHEFFKFFTDLLRSSRYAGLFCSDDLTTVTQNSCLNANNSSRSMMSLRRMSQSKDNLNYSTCSDMQQQMKKFNRYSELITTQTSFSNSCSSSSSSSSSPPPLPPPMVLEEKVTKSVVRNRQKAAAGSGGEQTTTTITKHCISNPCAFQHINSLKDNDQHVKLLIETFNFNSPADSSAGSLNDAVHAAADISAANSAMLKKAKSFKKK